jgi:nicotinamidase-related amidase
MLIDRAQSVLVLIDIQERLMPAIADSAEIIENARRLAEAASLLEVPVKATEQYPRGLGATVPELKPFLPEVVSKTSFCAVPEQESTWSLLPPERGEIVIAGAEAHVCVLQTVLELRNRNVRTVVVADAVGSRAQSSRDRALDRMRDHGVEIVTTEMVLFEWLRDSTHPVFRDVQRLIR